MMSPKRELNNQLMVKLLMKMDNPYRHHLNLALMDSLLNLQNNNKMQVINNKILVALGNSQLNQNKMINRLNKVMIS